VKATDTVLGSVPQARRSERQSLFDRSERVLGDIPLSVRRRPCSTGSHAWTTVIHSSHATDGGGILVGVRRLLVGAVVFGVWGAVSFVTFLWILLSDALGEEVGRQPPWRLSWLPLALSVACGCFVSAVLVAAIGIISRRRPGRATGSQLSAGPRSA
jgi:hypothetical protein